MPPNLQLFINMNKLNIAFCKNGKSIKFSTKTYSPAGGDNEAGQCLRLLANNNPNTMFYIVGRSDFHKLTTYEKSQLFDYDNVVYILKDCKNTDRDYIQNKLKQLNVKIDACVMLVGQIGTVTIPGKIKQIKNPSLIASTIDMTLGYSSMINEWLNDNLDIPVIEICNDPRYRLDQSRDIIFNPKVSLSQFDEEYIKRHIISYKDQTLIYTPVQQKYAEMEKIFLYGREMPQINAQKRGTTFAVVLNEGNPSRFNLLNEWILKAFDNVEVFGVWDEKHTKNNPRFKGPLKLEEMHEVMSYVRCTFCIPIAPGWVTSKWVEMIHAGVVPFFHPTYDMQNHTKVPEFLRPKTKQELLLRINMMKDDGTYTTTISMLRKKYLTPEYFDGTRLNQIIMQSIDPEYVRSDKTVKQTEVDNLEGFF